MPHFFLPLNWLLAPVIIIAALIITISLIFWATPSLNFPKFAVHIKKDINQWAYISERMLFSIFVHLSSKQKDSSFEKSNLEESQFGTCLLNRPLLL